ncbi:MAG: hypothetical protein DME04_15730 [Candidatus Rokuibacteriota bacterium]|nr:MAG: hypothetical protein DME04_15730 [Candidatus Rokubacteria bacterium]
MRAGMSRCGMWSTRTLTPFLSPHSLANLSYQASYAGMKWLHWRIRSVVPLIWAGACRASSIVRRELPATPAPATLRNFRRLTAEEGVSAGRGSRIVSLLGCPSNNSSKGLASLCVLTTTCQVVSARPGFANAILAAMRRPLATLVVVLAAVGALTGGSAWLLDTPKAPPGASRAERLYLGLCATCHGADGHGSWRAALFMVRPGSLADSERLGRRSDQYLWDIIKHGGAPIGRPGMPAFGSTISDAEIEELVRYVRGLAVKR